MTTATISILIYVLVGVALATSIAIVFVDRWLDGVPQGALIVRRHARRWKTALLCVAPLGASGIALLTRFEMAPNREERVRFLDAMETLAEDVGSKEVAREIVSLKYQEELRASKAEADEFVGNLVRDLPQQVLAARDAEALGHRLGDEYDARAQRALGLILREFDLLVERLKGDGKIRSSEKVTDFDLMVRKGERKREAIRVVEFRGGTSFRMIVHEGQFLRDRIDHGASVSVVREPGSESAAMFSLYEDGIVGVNVNETRYRDAKEFRSTPNPIDDPEFQGKVRELLQAIFRVEVVDGEIGAAAKQP